MLAKEAVAARLDAGGISYTEFSYQVMQALDFLELYRRHGVTLQLGGSDQWGNLTAGVDLIRRVEGAQAHALATPLITRPDGEKFGKSTGSTLWLDPALTTPFAFYQWFLNADDSVVGHLPARLQLPLREEIEALEARVPPAGRARGPARAGAEVTELVHGPEAAAGAADASRGALRRRRPRRPGPADARRPPSPTCRGPTSAANGTACGHRPAGRVRAVGEPRPGPTRGRRGRRLRQQRPRHRPGRGAGSVRAPRRPLAAPASRQAQSRRRRGPDG